MADITTLYELATVAEMSHKTLLNDIDMSVTNPANVSLWSAGTYTQGQWVRHTPAVAENTYYCLAASTTEEPGVGGDWEEMWLTSTGWPGIPHRPSSIVNHVFDGGGFALQNCWFNQATKGTFNLVDGHLYPVTIRNLRITNIECIGRGVICGSQLNDFLTMEDIYIQGQLIPSNEIAAAIVSTLSGTATRVFADVTIGASSNRRTCGFCSSVGAAGVVTNCGFKGSVAYTASTTSVEIAGFCRSVLAGGVVNNCYAVCSFTNAPNASGFVNNNLGIIKDCYWNTTVGPSISNDGAAFGITSAQMSAIATYTDAERLQPVTDEAVGTGDGTTTVFQLNVLPIQNASESIYLDGGTAETSGYTLSNATGALTFDVAPGVGVVITADYMVELTPWDMVAGYNAANVWGLDAGENGGYPFLQSLASGEPPASGPTPPYVSVTVGF